MICVQSRLRYSNEYCKTPPIPPKNNPITEKYVLHVLKLFNHCGPEQTLATVRRSSWLQGNRREVKWILLKCHCQKQKLLGQRMAPLPPERVDSPVAFQHIAVDFFGPLYTPTKVYGIIFSCFHSQAIHLELLNGMTTEDFFQAF